MPKMAVQTAIVLVLVAVGVVLVACGGGNGDGTEVLGGPCPSKTPAATEIEGDMTTNELIDLVAEAMTCPGHVIHLQADAVYEYETYGIEAALDAWIDIDKNAARTTTIGRAVSGEALREAIEAGLEDAERRDTVIYLPDARYTGTELLGYPDDENEIPPAKRRPPSCHGVGREALGALISCEGPLSEWETTVRRDVSFENLEAVALLAQGESSDADSTWAYESWLYFDAETLLPLGAVVESTAINGGSSFDTRTSYEYGFVPLDSLPADFFEPASIGYVEKDPEEPLDGAEIAVYWLGSTFEGNGEYPALALDHAFVRPRAQAGEFGFIAELTYRPADDEFGYPLVSLELLTPEDWKGREEHTRRHQCEETVALEGPGALVELQRHYHDSAYNPGDPCTPPDRFSAAVYFDDVVVRIDAPSVQTFKNGTVHSPYNSEAAIELLARSLVLRE